MYAKLSLKNNLHAGTNLLLGWRFIIQHPPGRLWEFRFQLRTATDVFGITSELTFPRETHYNEMIHVKGFVNGLVLLYSITRIRPNCDNVPEIKLWNPSIRKSLEVPLPPGFVPYRYPSTGDHVLQLQLGHDPTNNDYKVLVFMKTVGKMIFPRDIPAYARIFFDTYYHDLREDIKVFYQPPTSVKVYSVNTGVWRTIWSVDGNDNYSKNARFWWHLSHPQFLNGVIYSIGHDTSIRDPDVRFKSARVVSFNVSSEVFKWTIKVPAYQSLSVRNRNALGVIGKSLAYMATFMGDISIWLMDQSTLSTSVEECCWSRVFMIYLQINGLYTGTAAYLLTRSEELLVFTSPNSAVSYDIKSQQVKKQYENIRYRFSIVGDYVESLALVKTGKLDKVTYGDLGSYQVKA